MRCPKCGFISFDHLTSCASCGRDISEVASELQGTSIKVEPPMFLGGALAAFTSAEDSSEEHAMDADDEGIDFNMEMGAEEEEVPEMAAAEEEVDFNMEVAAEEEEGPEMAAADEEVDFSFEEEAEEFQVAEETDISPEGADEEVLVMEEETEEGAAIELEADADEGGLEFDLDDFMEDDDDFSDASADDEVAEIDIDLDDKDK
jgi:hypothetical protein